MDKKADDKTCDWMAKDDYRVLGRGEAVVIYFMMNIYRGFDLGTF